MSSNDVYVLGLTGGIGTGKSTAAQYITSKGYIHIDADAIGRTLTEEGSPLLEVLDKKFATKDRPILDERGRLDRKALASIVFSDPEKKRILDGIMFEKIAAVIRERIDDADGPVLLDAPLLFESGIDSLCDEVILITCDIRTRLERVAARDASEKEEILARIRNQMSDEEKIPLADYVVDNSGTIEELHKSLEEIINII